MSEPALTEEMYPSHYIEKVSLLTGEPLEDDILPKQLLVHYHRDYHVVDVQARAVMSRMVEATGDEEKVRSKMKEVRRLGQKTAGMIAKVFRREDEEKISKALFGLKDEEYYFRFKTHPFSNEEIEEKIERLRTEAEEKIEATRDGGHFQLRVLLTGGTGFVGKEIMWQAAHNPHIAEIVVVIRPKTIRDRKTKEIVKVISPEERGKDLLRQLWLEGEMAERFRFVAGDVEKPLLGIDHDEFATLKSTITHVIHCAASVAFDDPYPTSFRANVAGSLNALESSLELQEAEGSPFVAHIGIETSYIHGRQIKRIAREDEIVFPRNFYNNYYELTKAMASIETERFMLEKGLRVVQLCPAIVIGEAGTGNNRGDSKVVNAPVNLFGRAKEALDPMSQGKWLERSKGALLAKMVSIFPGDGSAQINLIPVDRVAEGIVAALSRPQAVGERVHLATDKRVSSEQIKDMVMEELGVKVKLAEPTIHRNYTLPVLSKLLKSAGQDRISYALNKLGTIFGSYSEWGQPIHEVGNDIRVLGLSEERPDAARCFRMLCRHNRYVQEFTKVRDLDEISRREKVWVEFIQRITERFGKPAGEISAVDFHRSVGEDLDLETFTLK